MTPDEELGFDDPHRTLPICQFTIGIDTEVFDVSWRARHSTAMQTSSAIVLEYDEEHRGLSAIIVAENRMGGLS